MQIIYKLLHFIPKTWGAYIFFTFCLNYLLNMKSLYKLLLGSFLSLFFFLAAFAQTTTVTLSGSTQGNFVNWFVPYGVTSIKVEAWGGGGGGAGVFFKATYPQAYWSGRGGGGGSYASAVYTVTPATFVSYKIGYGGSAGGQGNNLNNNLSNGLSLVDGSDGDYTAIFNTRAAGGVAGKWNLGFETPYGGEGGVYNNTIIIGGATSNVDFIGGSGSSSSLTGGNGGGSSAGTNNNGNSASGTSGGAAVTGGGAGGTAVFGVTGSSVRVGQSPGGGGAGGNTSYEGGSGGDGQIKITYTTPSADANLAALQFNSASLSPVFDSTILIYTAARTLSTSASFSFTRAVSGQEVRYGVNNQNYNDIISGNSQSVNLSAGNNTIFISVRSVDRNQIKYYRINVFGGVPAFLNSLSINTGAISPTFDTAQTSYTSANTYAQSATITVGRPASGDYPTSMVLIRVNSSNENDYSNIGSLNSTASVSLANGVNTIDVRVYASGLVSYKEYRITLTKISTDVDLSNLVVGTSNASTSLGNATLSPIFNQFTNSYTINISSAVTNVSIVPTKVNNSASISIPGAILSNNAYVNNTTLSVGSNVFNVNLTLAPNQSKTYTINVIRAAPAQNTLNVLGLNATNTSPAAYSLRKLSTAYTGFAIQVRRSNDNTTSNIGFTANGDLDTAALKTFVGANNGFVTIWYDQSGNGRNAAQTTAASQPQIIVSGIIYRRLGMPTIYFNSTSLATASFTGYPSAFTLSIIGGVQTNTTYPTFGAKNNTNIAGPWDQNSTSFFYGNNSAQSTITLTNGLNATSGFSQWSFIGSSSGGTAFRNGVANGTAGAASYADGGNPLYIGSRGDGATSLNGWISEYITFGTELNTTDRQTVENNEIYYHNFYGSKKGIASLVINNASLDKAFNSDTLSYSSEITNASINITTTKSATADDIMSYQLNGGGFTNLTNGAATNFNLNIGLNTIQIYVLESNNELIIYSITVTRKIPLNNIGLGSTTTPASFSLRKLSSDYSGNAIQVRRSNDNATTNIGFTVNGDLDTTALKTFVGANNGFVSIWYDQSGEGRNAAQATRGLQPQIISTGVVYRKNGKPTIYFINQSLATPSFTGYPNAFTLLITGGVQNNTSLPTFGGKTNSNTPGPWDMYNSNYLLGNGSSSTGFTLTNGINSSSKFSQWTFTANSSSAAAFRNGAANGSGSIFYGDAGTPLVLGSRGDGATQLNGWISEYVTFASVLGTTDRQTVEGNQSTYYNLSNANLSALTLSNGTISPAFTANTTSYTSTVSATSTTVTASLEFSEASIQVRINSGTYVSMANGGTSSALSLNIGSNTIDVKVAALDGSTLKVYTITIISTIAANALNFQQAGSNYINVPNSASITLGNSFTIEAWVNYSGTSRTIIDKGAYDNLLSLNPAGDNKLGFYSANTGAWRYSTGTIPQNTWTHVAVTLNSGTLTFYINGVASGTGSVTPTSSTGALNIGRQGPTNCFCNAYNGSMDELRIWNVARTANQILSNLNNELSAQTGLVALYHFNQGFVGANNTSILTALDESGNGNNGTLTSFTLTGNTSNWVQRTFSADARLSNLIISSETLAPVFDSAVISYTATVTNATTNITVTPTKVNAYATIQVRVNGGIYENVISGSVTSSLPLNVGSNIINVLVTAQDGSTTKIYTMTVTRAIAANALNFQQAGSNYINVPNSASITLGNSFTIEAWVNYSGTSRTIIDKGAYDNLLSLNPAGDNKLGFYSANTGAWRYSTGTIPQNTWTHVAVTLNSGTLTFYINGVASGTGSVTPTSSTGALNIGRQGPTNCFCNAYNGSMDELRIWNVARTANQILSNLNNELSAQTGLVALYHFNQGSVGANNTSILSALDESGNGNNGTLTSFTLTGNTSNWVQRTFSTDARLSNLITSSGTLAPVFDSAVISYTATVTNATTNITVMPIKVNAYATIQVRVNGGSYENVISGNATSSLPINVSSNTINVLVTAQDGTTTKTYTITVTRNAVPTWTGSTSNEWNLASNWSPAEIPASNSNVVIGNSNNDPVLNANTIVNDLTLYDTLVIGNNTLTINGAISGSSVLRGASNSNLTITGASGTIRFDQSSMGNTNVLRNLTISGSGTTVLGNTLNISAGGQFGVVNVGSGATLTTGGYLILKSSPFGTAAIGVSAGTINGNITMERFISASGRRWRYISAPVTGQTLADWGTKFYITGPGTPGATVGLPNSNGYATTRSNLLGFNNAASTPSSVRMYSRTVSGSIENGWSNPPLNMGLPLQPGVGYRAFVRGPITGNYAQDTVTIGFFNTALAPPSQASFVFSQTGGVVNGVNAGTVNLPINSTGTGASGAFNTNTDGWNLLGNPYPCAFNWVAFWNSNSNRTNISPAIYVFDATANSYKTYSTQSGSGTLTSGIIPAGAAFFVQATGIGASLTLNEAFKITSSAPIELHKKSLIDEIHIKYYKDSTESDEYILKMIESATLQKDDYDIAKLKNDNLNLSSYGIDSINLTLSSIPYVSSETRIKLNVEATQIGTYNFDFANLATFQSNISIQLFDRYKNKTIDVRKNNRYTFEMGPDSNQWGKNRFELILNNAKTGDDEKANTILNTMMKGYPNPATEVLNISLNNVNIQHSKVKIYNVSGIEVLENEMTNNKTQINIEHLSSGLYFVRVINENGFDKTEKFMK